MKKRISLILSIILLTFCFSACTKQETENPGEVVVNFLNALQDQDYSRAKSYYKENLDNLANFRNKIEAISPSVANELFNKLADFSYTIKKVEINANDPTKANVYVNFQCYNVGSAFESTLLEYAKTDLEMTFDGAKDEEIIKKAEEVIMTELTSSQKNYYKSVAISVIKEDKTWVLDKISQNKDFLNVLSGNIINTIDQLSSSLPSA